MIVAIDQPALDIRQDYILGCVEGLLRRNFILHATSRAMYVIEGQMPEGVRSIYDQPEAGTIEVYVAKMGSRLLHRPLRDPKADIIIIGQPDENTKPHKKVHYAENWWDVYQILCRLQIQSKAWMR